MGLSLYNKKRKFRDTPEPSGKLKKSSSKLIFVVQRHKASHLHYDFRLEIDGVLKSWAVPKGPSLNPTDKRLAMMVEDHPFSYRTFEGVIPEGNYGAGIVEIWDKGTLSDLENSDTKTTEKKLKAGLRAGNLKFTLRGKKLKGEFALVKLKGKQENAWLLIKHNDKNAIHEPYNSEDHTAANSPINKWLTQHKKPTSKSKLTKKTVIKKNEVENESTIAKKVRALPGKTKKLSKYIHPMLAREVPKAFSNKEWIYEIKWDGYRAIAEINKDKVQLYSRNGNTFNESYPLVTNELQKLKINAVLDGEIVVLDDNGTPSFQLLQHYKSANEYPIQFYVFDLLEINGKNICDQPLIERKKLLKKLIPKNNVIKYSDHIVEAGEEFFELAQKRNLEGIIAKKADSEYRRGVRTNEWLKIKHHKSQEAIIAGFTKPGGTRKYFGALVLGIKDGKKLKYVGHTGSGFDQKLLKELYSKLTPLIQNESPFSESIKTNSPVKWVKPVLVCEIKFTELTHDGMMRHPIFLRLRDDKKAKEVVMESPGNMTFTPQKNKPATKKASPKKSKTAISKATSQKGKTNKRQFGKENTEELLFGKIKVPITNSTKIFWPEEQLTKGDVIAYYQNIANYIIPYLKDRPQSLLRTPNGINKASFYHKDAGGESPDWVKTIDIFSESTNKTIEYILCNNKATLAYLNNLGCIELNPWHSTIKALDYPDYLVIDLDPSPKNTFEQVIETAQVVKGILDKAGATSYCKTSGATGLHIYVPTSKKYTYEQIKKFTELICILTHEQLPKFTSNERSLKKRGNNIYLDHLQNRRGQTIACVYSLRPKKGATISTPLHWREVKQGLDPLDFNIHSVAKRLKKNGDIFTGILGKGIDLLKCLKNLEK